jgi:CheY-like chemotaxis protein
MPKTILAVDDDRMSLALVKRKLEDNGFEVMTAGNGQEALAQLAQKVPDMILLDVEMPVMNGYTFMMEKAKTPAFVSIPVVVLTAHEENEPLFKRHGVRGYLIKPLNMEQLLTKVAETVAT